jgi:hypothetical protein
MIKKIKRFRLFTRTFFRAPEIHLAYAQMSFKALIAIEPGYQFGDALRVNSLKSPTLDAGIAYEPSEPAWRTLLCQRTCASHLI